jgi:hypothetical protein
MDFKNKRREYQKVENPHEHQPPAPRTMLLLLAAETVFN